MDKNSCTSWEHGSSSYYLTRALKREVISWIVCLSLSHSCKKTNSLLEWTKLILVFPSCSWTLWPLPSPQKFPHKTWWLKQPSWKIGSSNWIIHQLETTAWNHSSEAFKTIVLGKITMIVPSPELRFFGWIPLVKHHFGWPTSDNCPK